MIECLVRRITDRAVWVQDMGHDIVLCSCAKDIALKLPLTNLVLKPVLASIMLGVTLRQTNIPSMGE